MIEDESIREDRLEKKRAQNRLYNKRYRQKNLEKCRKYDNEYKRKYRDRLRKENPAKYKIWKKKRRLRETYKISLNAYNNYLKEQNFICPICNEFLPEDDRCVEHCHKTGIVRGIVHTNCNSFLGFGGDDPDRIKLMSENAIVYLSRSCVKSTEGSI